MEKAWGKSEDEGRKKGGDGGERVRASGRKEGGCSGWVK